MKMRLVVGIPLVAVLLVAAVMLGSAQVVFAQDAVDPHTAAAMAAEPESCMTCHKDSGAAHQEAYDELYQDGVIQISDIAYSFADPDASTVTFQMTKDGAPYDGTTADQLAIYFSPYVDGKFQFEPAIERMSLLGDLSYDGAGGMTSTITGTTDLSAVDGIIVIYGTDEIAGRLPARVQQGKFPFAGILQTGAGVDYVSPANNDGCVKCHSDPYLKHGYIYGQVNNDPATDFLTCKACHLDNGEGGHFEWKLLVEDPALAAAYLAGEVELTPEQQEQYAYNTTLMNDVHMSHAMEFPYPQSMANCVTCHEGKLDEVLSDANFTGATCKSCHPVTGSEEYGTAELALENLWPPRIHEDVDLDTSDCAECHTADGDGPAFNEIHTGYNNVIYTADGIKYSDAISVTIDSASFDGSQLTVAFSAAASPEIEGLNVSDIAPTVMVGLYGYDTKDFIIGPHERLFDDNGDGEITSDGDQRTLEYEVGADHPRASTVSAGDGKWEVTMDLSPWADMMADGTVKRVEIGVMPALANEDDVALAINATSRTFDLGANDFADDFYAPIAQTVNGCNDCHEALGTTFHSPDHGGSITVCRMCHITKSGASHLEMQSRSLDSYIHAIHSGQPFDVADIDFTDPVANMEYEHHIEFPYPKHGSTDCLSCHVEDTFNVPDQSKSLPGLLSASAEITGWDRNIGTVPEVVAGPAARACGGCHRAELINEDAAGELVSLDQHMKQGGYAVEAGEDDVSTLMSVIQAIMAYFQ